MATELKIGLQAIVLGKKYKVAEDRVLDAVAAAGYDALECVAEDPAADSTFKPPALAVLAAEGCLNSPFRGFR